MVYEQQSANCTNSSEWYPAIKNTSTAKSRILAVLKAAIKTFCHEETGF